MGTFFSFNILTLLTVVLVQAASADLSLLSLFFLHLLLFPHFGETPKDEILLVQAACVHHPWWRTKRSWPLFLSTFFFLSFGHFSDFNGQRLVTEPGPTLVPGVFRSFSNNRPKKLAPNLISIFNILLLQNEQNQ